MLLWMHYAHYSISMVLYLQQFDAILSCFQAEVNIFHAPDNLVFFEFYHVTSTFIVHV